MKPRISILNPEFKYRSAAATDVRETWRKARRRLRITGAGDALAPIPPSPPKATAAPAPVTLLPMRKVRNG